MQFLSTDHDVWGENEHYLISREKVKGFNIVNIAQRGIKSKISVPIEKRRTKEIWI